MIFYTGIIILLGVSSCEKQGETPYQQDSSGTITSMPHVWKKVLSEDGSLIDGFLRLKTIYKNGVLFIGRSETQSNLTMLSIVDGKTQWKWSDYILNNERPDLKILYYQDKYWVAQDGSRFYHIDLSTGSTINKEKRNYHVAHIEGDDNMYYMSANFIVHTSGSFVGGVYVGDVVTGKEELLLVPPYTQNYVNGNDATGYINKIALIEGNKDSDKLLVVTYSDVVPEWRTNNYLGLYNLTKKEWLYQKEEVSFNEDAIAGSSLAIYKDKIYLTSGKQIMCHDLYSGKRLWEKRFGNIFFFSGFIIVDDKIIANNEDTYLYALDPDTGNQLWRTKSSGTSSPMAHLNGVVYFVGGGDGLLHAVEIATGKHLWRIKSPDLGINRGAWFKREVMALPPEQKEKKGKVLVSSYLSAFCYEAAR